MGIFFSLLKRFKLFEFSFSMIRCFTGNGTQVTECLTEIVFFTGRCENLFRVGIFHQVYVTGDKLE